MSTRFSVLLAVVAVVIAGSVGFIANAGNSAGAAQRQPTQLAVVWSSGDADVAHRVCLMYTHAARKNKWFDEVELIVWGPSSRLLAGDKDLQAKIKEMKKDGVILKACKACADSFGVSDDLEELGIEVKYMGKPLSEMLQSDWKVITF